MTRYIIRRILSSIFVLLAVITVSLWLTRQAPSNPCLKEKQVNTCACLKKHHLDRPVFPVYVGPPTKPREGCSFWEPDASVEIGPITILPPFYQTEDGVWASNWDETQFARYMGFLVPRFRLESSPGVYWDDPDYEFPTLGGPAEGTDIETKLRFAPADLGGDVLGLALNVSGAVVNIAEGAVSGVVSIPGAIAGREGPGPDIYFGSEHLFIAAKNLSATRAGPGIAVFASLGPSMRTSRLVLPKLLSGLPYTLQLGIQALLLALLIGVPAGMYAGLRQNTLTDYTTMTFAMAGVAIPNFVLGPILILIFALGLGWFDPTGWDDFSDSVLPTITLSLYYAAYIARLTRGGMLEMIRKDFVRTARAKGLSEKTIVFRHTSKGTLLPVVSYLGPAFAALLTGSVVVEQIFSLPGIGRNFVTAAQNRDYNLVLGTVIIYSTFLVALNFAVDIVYTWIDPRVDYDEA